MYGCRNCEKNGIEVPIRTAPAPNPVIEKGLASPSAIAYVMTMKFVEAVPLYRQEQHYRRLGVELSRAVLSNWMIRGSEWLELLYRRMREKLIERDILHADETVVEKFRQWLDELAVVVLPKSLLGVAVNYCRHQWPKLIRFLEDSRLELSNNRAERSIKPFVIGRKNWLFSNTPKGARSSAVIYSLIETAKENGLNPYAYLNHLFEQLPNLPSRHNEHLDPLLPWNVILKQPTHSS